MPLENKLIYKLKRSINALEIFYVRNSKIVFWTNLVGCWLLYSKHFCSNLFSKSQKSSLIANKMISLWELMKILQFYFQIGCRYVSLKTPQIIMLLNSYQQPARYPFSRNMSRRVFSHGHFSIKFMYYLFNARGFYWNTSGNLCLRLCQASTSKEICIAFVTCYEFIEAGLCGPQGKCNGRSEKLEKQVWLKYFSAYIIIIFPEPK